MRETCLLVLSFAIAGIIANPLFPVPVCGIVPLADVHQTSRADDNDPNTLRCDLSGESNRPSINMQPLVSSNDVVNHTQALLHDSPLASMQGDKSHEQSELPASKMEPITDISTPWTRSDYFNLAIFIGALLTISITLWLPRRSRKQQIDDEVMLNFEVLPWAAISSEERQNLLFSFYSGGLDADPTICVSSDLDADRKLLTEITTLIQKNESKEWFHIPIYGGRKQGKSIVMARLAHNLSREKGRLRLRSKYCILWSKQRGTQFQEHLEKGENLYKYAVNLSKWRKYYVWKKRLIVFIDDFYRPDLEESDCITQLGNLKNFLNELNKKRISVITSSSSEGAQSNLSEKEFKLKLEEDDIGAILSKLVLEKRISQQVADEFASDHSWRRLYKKQLFAFLNILLSNAGWEVSFVKTFEAQFNKLSSKEKILLKTIALCQVVDISLSESILQQAFPSELSQLQTGLGGLVRREQYLENNDASCIYHMGGPFLAKWLLEEKFSVRTANDLQRDFQTLFNLLLSNEMFNNCPQSHKVIRLVLKRLAAGWHIPIFDFDTKGKNLAKGLLEYSKNCLEPYLNNLTYPSDLVIWAATLRELGEYDLATRFYQKAAEKIQMPEEPPTVQNMRTPISLAMGLSAMPDADSRIAAISLVEKIVEKYKTAENQSWILLKIVHKLAETLYKADQLDKALEMVNKLPTYISADALLLLLKGDILLAQGDPIKANDCFTQSIKTAREEVAWNPQTLFNCLQHYADFLVNHPVFAKSLGEDPESYIKQGEDLFKEVTDLDGYESLLNIRAKLKVKQGDILGAKATYEDCYAYCHEKGIVNPYSWNDFAKFLKDHGDQFREKSIAEWLAEAESLCREVIDNPDVDAESRRTAAHILGGSIGKDAYTFKGQKRPNFSEAIRILEEKAFESSKPNRDDDQKKTFQDAMTHRMLKDTYLEWYDSESPPPEGKDRNYLFAQVDFHFKRAFSGLPRPDLCSHKVIEHALLNESHYAAFLWQPRVGPPNLDAAEQHYKDAIAKFQANSHTWPEAYRLYEFYSVFLYKMKRSPHLIVQLLHEDRHISSDTKAKILGNLAHGFHTNLLNNLTSEDAVSEMDEIIWLFAETLKLNPGNRMAAKELGLLFFARKHGLLKHLITKSGVEKAEDILCQAWIACPANGDSLRGIFYIADTIIDKEFHDENKLKDIAESISQKAVEDKTAGEVLGDILSERRSDPFRGGLTDILLGS